MLLSESGAQIYVVTQISYSSIHLALCIVRRKSEEFWQRGKWQEKQKIGSGQGLVVCFSCISTSSAVLLFSQHKKYTDAFEADKMRTVKQFSVKLEES